MVQEYPPGTTKNANKPDNLYKKKFCLLKDYRTTYLLLRVNSSKPTRTPLIFFVANKEFLFFGVSGSKNKFISKRDTFGFDVIEAKNLSVF